MTLMTFAIGGLAYWMPKYLATRGVGPLFGLGPRTLFGVITATSGLMATLAGGWAGDRLRTRFSGSYFLVSGAAMFLAFPAIFGFLYAPFPFAWVFVFVSVFCLFFNTGPTNTILANVTPASFRASAFALNILIIHLFGDVISPPLIGYVSDKFGPGAGFYLVPWSVLLGGIFWVLGAPHLEADTRRAG